MRARLESVVWVLLRAVGVNGAANERGTAGAGGDASCDALRLGIAGKAGRARFESRAYACTSREHVRRDSMPAVRQLEWLGHARARQFERSGVWSTA